MNSTKDKEGGIKHLSSQILQITIQCKIEWFHMKHPDIVKLKNVIFTISVYIQILKLPFSKFRNALVNIILFNKLDII
jgi:hypothetical protein